MRLAFMLVSAGVERSGEYGVPDVGRSTAR
jgi:hypothetical protein